VLDGNTAAPDPSLLEVRVLLRACTVVGFADMVLAPDHTAGPDIVAPAASRESSFAAPRGTEHFDTVTCSGGHCSSMSGRCTMHDLGAGDNDSGFTQDWRSGLALWGRRRGQDAVDANIQQDVGAATPRQRRFFHYYYLANTVFGFRARQPMPPCAVAAVRAAHPNELGCPYVVGDIDDEGEGEDEAADQSPGPPPYPSSEESDDSCDSQHTYDSTPAEDREHMLALLSLTTEVD
jgi:hypothetical protein